MLCKDKDIYKHKETEIPHCSYFKISVLTWVRPCAAQWTIVFHSVNTGFPGGSVGKKKKKKKICLQCGRPGSIPGLGRSSGGGHDHPLHYSCLENPQGQRSLVGSSPQGSKKSDTTERGMGGVACGSPNNYVLLCKHVLWSPLNIWYIP